MKKTSYFLLSMCIFFSCKEEKIAATLPYLKGFTVENTSANLITKTDYMFAYTDGELSQLQKIAKEEKAGVLQTYPMVNHLITRGASESYKIISDTESSSNLKMIYNADKSNGEFNITTYLGKNLQELSILTRNTENKVSKYEVVKPIVIGTNSVEFPKLPNAYARYEYDNQGNVSRIFQKNDNSPVEFLTNEYTYDNHPNPTKALLWFNRLAGDKAILSSSESNNNILTTKTYAQGVLVSETTANYVYETTTKLPIKVTIAGKSYNANTTISQSQITYRY